MQQTMTIALATTITLMSALYITSPANAVENAKGGAATTPIERLTATEKGQLKNPLTLIPEMVTATSVPNVIAVICLATRRVHHKLSSKDESKT